MKLLEVFDNTTQKVKIFIQKDQTPQKRDRGGEKIVSVPIIPAGRSKWTFFLFFVGLVAVVCRALYLQGFNTEFLQKKGEERYARYISIPAQRGQIVDRNGVVLARSVPARSICAIPSQLEKASEEELRTLAKTLKEPFSKLKKRLKANTKRHLFYLARKMEVDDAKKVLALKIPGIYAEEEVKRNYPDGEVSAHVVGFTDNDNRGREGIELASEKTLCGEHGQRHVIRDRLGRIIEETHIKETSVGSDIVLSIDSRLQYIAHTAIKKAVENSGAKAGAVLIADVHTGEILALNNWPSYDPNHRRHLNQENVRNRVMTDPFEPGSTMKPFAIAKALDLGIVRPDTLVQTGPGILTMGEHKISDTHNYGLITVSQVVAKSSNIGTCKIALEIESEDLYNTYTALGFGQQPRVEFPGATAGILRKSSFSRPVEKATISYGYGLSASLIQLVRAYTSLARNGDVIDLTFKKSSGEAHGRQIFKPEVARQMRAMMSETVQEGGTAQLVSVQGYTIAGKTGTANKLVGGQYVDKKAYASFIGMAPASHPRLIVAVMIDEPAKGSYFGGRVATPVFNDVTANALRLMGVNPDDERFVASSTAYVKSFNNR